MTDKELQLKKTARRRLVGAVTLVILMLIILPFVLKDRMVDVASSDAVQITLMDQAQKQQEMPTLPERESVPGNESTADVNPLPVLPPTVSNTVPKSDKAGADKSGSDKSVSEKSAATALDQNAHPANSEHHPDLPAGESRAVAAKKPLKPASNIEPKVEAKLEQKHEATNKPAQVSTPPSDKHAGGFYVQFGVFSETRNLESLKNKLTQAGFHVVSEKIESPKATQGAIQKMRLRSEYYNNKADAMIALKKIQSAGFGGMIAKS